MTAGEFDRLGHGIRNAGTNPKMQHRIYMMRTEKHI